MCFIMIHIVKNPSVHQNNTHLLKRSQSLCIGFSCLPCTLGQIKGDLKNPVKMRAVEGFVKWGFGGGCWGGCSLNWSDLL